MAEKLFVKCLKSKTDLESLDDLSHVAFNSSALNMDLEEMPAPQPMQGNIAIFRPYYQVVIAVDPR